MKIQSWTGRWNEHFTNFLKQSSLEQLKSEQYIFKNKKGTLFLAIYIYDGLLVKGSEEDINGLIRH